MGFFFFISFLWITSALYLAAAVIIRYNTFSIGFMHNIKKECYQCRQKLILSSKLPSANRFKRLVTSVRCCQLSVPKSVYTTPEKPPFRLKGRDTAKVSLPLNIISSGASGIRRQLCKILYDQQIRTNNSLIIPFNALHTSRECDSIVLSTIRLS